jgi:hypothetical protein
MVRARMRVRKKTANIEITTHVQANTSPLRM